MNASGERPSILPPPARIAVFVIEDDAPLRQGILRTLSAEGYQARGFGNLTDAKAALVDADPPPGVIVTDLELPDGLGTEILDAVDAFPPGRIPPGVVLQTGKGTIETAVLAMKRGAYDFLPKPAAAGDLLRAVARAAERFALLQRNDFLQSRLEARDRMEGFVCSSPPMREATRLIGLVAPTSATVLITGESGTGKEILSRQVHLLSPRSAKRYLTINCGSLSPTLLESELFGHAKGSFTGASGSHIGLFEQANGGTILLDEIGELSPASQVHLLRVLQEGTVRPVGGSEERKVDARVIAATHRDLRAMVEAKTFRQDLYFRINVFSVHVPPLRERRDDILPLTVHLILKHAQRLGMRPVGLAEAASTLLLNYDWPGNVRELENVIERALILARGEEIGAQCLPSELRQSSPPTQFGLGDLPMADAREAFERRYLQGLLDRCGGNLSEAARQSGVDRSNLRRLLKRHGLAGKMDG
jgi:DNA-binding NtrC family response regulator